MRAVEIIEKKRDGKALSAAEIRFFIEGFTNGDIPDYQASAWAMAVLLNGMTPEEVTNLTMAMVASGQVLDLTQAVPFVVDKHSTGGVGDKTTLVVGPLVAACGLPVGKMSGRGLGFTGGTLDKMESIPGFNCNLSTEAFIKQLCEIGFVLSGQTVSLAPADGRLYGLRDVTGTVPSIPLIASSIMSKKIASGAQAIVLDVKVGTGAFVKTLEQGRELASLMVEIGRRVGRNVVAMLSDMSQPLGYAVGNALEVHEAVETLHGRGPEDLREHCLIIAAQMLVLGKIQPNLDKARKMAEEQLDNGQAFKFFREMVAAQGGEVTVVDNLDLLPKAPFQETVYAESGGFVKAIDAHVVGETTVVLGAGRAKKGDAIDHSVGVVVHQKVGNSVKAGEPLFTVHAHTPAHLADGVARVRAAFEWSEGEVPPLPLFYETIP